MEFNIVARTNKKNMAKKHPKVHIIARRRKLQKERRSKVRGNREVRNNIKVWQFNHFSFQCVDAEMETILSQETRIEEESTIHSKTTPQINIFQQYLMFLENNRNPFENRRIETMITFDAYINAIDVAKRNQERIDRFYQNHKFNEDEDEDEDYDEYIDCHNSECDCAEHCQRYTLFPNDDGDTINDLLFKYERQNWAKCENEEECDCPRCTEKREEQEALVQMCHSRNKVKSARGGIF
jgi:hypothetical protein